MNILVIYPEPDMKRKPRFGFSYEMMQIATVLSKHHTVTVKDFSCENDADGFIYETCLSRKCDVALIECDSFALKRSQNIVHAKIVLAKLSPICKTIAYGNYCYITQKDMEYAYCTIKQNDINQVIETINRIEGLDRVPLITTFDEMPYIDRTLLLSIPYYMEHKKCTLLQTAKGCENTCVFCQRKGWQSCYVTHSDEYVILEIERVKEEGFSEIWIIDENFTFNLSRAKRLLRKILELSLMDGLNLFISSWANIDNEFICLAANSNVKIMSFGIESGNTEILAFYRKNIKIEKIPAIIQYANSCGIFTVGNFIIGAPDETEKTISQTFELIRNCEFDQVNIKILNYMIGSELYQSLDANQKNKDSVFACKENGLTSFSLTDMVEMKKRFLEEYYDEHKSQIARKIQRFGRPYEFD